MNTRPGEAVPQADEGTALRWSSFGRVHLG